MTKVSRVRSSMAINIIGAIIALLVVFGIVVSLLGYVSFTNAFTDEYSTTTYHMLDTATTEINGDHIDDYLNGKEMDEYYETKIYLDTYCKKMNVSLIYLIKVDTSDFGSFVSIFNSVNNAVDNSNYKEWELGYRRQTTNEEYAGKYRALYEQKTKYATIFRLKPADGSHPHITTMVPVIDSYGHVVSILCMQRPISELNRARKPYLTNVALSTLALSLFAALFVAVYLQKHFVNPVKMLSDEATRFAQENIKGEPLGDISRFEEIVNLATSIDKMETDMVEYIDHLTSITAEKERAAAEPSIAATIQENSVPNRFPAFPDRDDFDIYASMTPAKGVGGDFYNFFLIDDDHLAIVIGDVSGKGVPGALFMMVCNILIANRTMMGGSPGDILTFVNDDLCEHNEAEMFVTLWLGILELSTGQLIAANAGHDDAAVYRHDGSFELFKTRHGLVAAGFPGIHYKDFVIHLDKGDKIFLYTDGVPEATDAEGQMFTINGMLDALNRYKDKSPQEILEGVHNSVNAFVKEAPQFDDLTVLCVEMK